MSGFQPGFQPGFEGVGPAVTTVTLTQGIGGPRMRPVDAYALGVLQRQREEQRAAMVAASDAAIAEEEILRREREAAAEAFSALVRARMAAYEHRQREDEWILNLTEAA